MTPQTWQEFTDFESVSAIWSTLLSQSSTRTIFQELSVQKSWWISAGQPALHIVVIFEEEQPIAQFPFCLRNNTLQFLGDQGVSDYLDALIIEEKQALAFAGLEEYLSHKNTWQKIELVSLPEHSLTFDGMKNIADHNHYTFTQTQQDVCPIIELPATWDEYLSNVGKKQRHEIKRKWLRLEEQGNVTFRVVTSTIDDSEALKTFFTLHRQSSIEKDNFWTSEHVSYFEELSSAVSEGGWLRLYFLDFNGEAAATMYCFEYGDDLLIYNSGFNASSYVDKSIGHVITAYTIKDAIERKKKRYDFLRGGEEYKMRYRPTAHPVFNVVVEKAASA